MTSDEAIDIAMSHWRSAGYNNKKEEYYIKTSYEEAGNLVYPNDAVWYVRFTQKELADAGFECGSIVIVNIRTGEAKSVLGL